MHVLPLHVRNTMKSEILSMEARIRLTFGHEAKKVERILKIYNIYESNCFDDGLSIKTSRFNHSCQPNAGRGQPFQLSTKKPYYFETFFFTFFPLFSVEFTVEK